MLTVSHTAAPTFRVHALTRRRGGDGAKSGVAGEVGRGGPNGAALALPSFVPPPLGWRPAFAAELASIRGRRPRGYPAPDGFLSTALVII